MTPTETEPQFPAVVDNTMRTAFVTCPRQFYEAHILNRAPKGGSVHLVAGGAYARGLEVVRKCVYGLGTTLDEALIAAFPLVAEEYGNFPCPEDKAYKSFERVWQGLIAYFDHYDPHSDHIVPYMLQNGEPAVEFTFAFPTQIAHPETGEPILYAGRFDMIGVYSGLPFVVDDKTASQLGPSWDKSWRLKSQLTGYVFAAQQYGIPVEGAIVRGISFLRTGAYGFSEPIEYKGEWEIERWWVQLHRDLARMVACWEDRDDQNPYGYWDYNLHDACSAFGGCPFQQLCSVVNPDDWAKNEFERRDWNPLSLNPAKISVADLEIRS